MKKNTLIKALAVAICASMVAVGGTVALADSSYIVKKGDNLWKIAKEMLGDGARYNDIFDANRDKIKDPNRIYVGQELVIPDGKAASEGTAQDNNTAQTDYANVPGRYVRVYSEEIEGNNIEVMDVVELKEDHTCTVDFQDTVAGKWDGNKITLDNGDTCEFKIEDGNLLLNQDGIWLTFYRDDESNINPPVLTAEDQYASIISQLKPGQAYGFADICSSFDALLVSEDGAYDYGDGIMGAINVKIYGLDADGNIIEYGEANSGGTAYPLAVYDGCLMTCNNYRTMMEYISDETFSMITKKCVEKSYDEKGNATYSYMDADTQTEGTTDDDSMMQEMYEIYGNAIVVNFTVKEGQSNINPPVLAAQEQYASIISQLKPGQAYGFADICSSFDALLVSENGAYDYGDGIMGAINVKIYGLDADGNVIEYGTANSGGTAYPLAVYDGCLMTCNNYRTMMEFIDDTVFSMVTKKCVEKSYDEKGNATYSYMDYDTRSEGTTDDDSMMQEMYEIYGNAIVVNFTVVK